LLLLFREKEKLVTSVFFLLSGCCFRSNNIFLSRNDSFHPWDLEMAWWTWIITCGCVLVLVPLSY